MVHFIAAKQGLHRTGNLLTPEKSTLQQNYITKSSQQNIAVQNILRKRSLQQYYITKSSQQNMLQCILG